MFTCIFVLMLYVDMHRVLECGRVSDYSHTKILSYFLCHVAEIHVRSIVNSSILMPCKCKETSVNYEFLFVFLLSWISSSVLVQSIFLGNLFARKIRFSLSRKNKQISRSFKTAVLYNVICY